MMQNPHQPGQPMFFPNAPPNSQQPIPAGTVPHFQPRANFGQQPSMSRAQGPIQRMPHMSGGNQR